MPYRIPDARPHKYHARPVTLDGIRFASTTEARRYRELTLLRRAGAIGELQLQPRFPITVTCLCTGALVTCGHYTADFRYVDRATGETVIEDAKSDATKTTAYRLRKRLIEAIHGITIREV